MKNNVRNFSLLMLLATASSAQLKAPVVEQLKMASAPAAKGNYNMSHEAQLSAKISGAAGDAYRALPNVSGRLVDAATYVGNKASNFSKSFQDNLNLKNNSFGDYQSTDQSLNLDSLYGDTSGEVSSEIPTSQTMSQRAYSAAKTAYNAPGAFVGALGGQGDFITGRTNSLASAGKATGRVVRNPIGTTGRAASNVTTFTTQKVQDLYTSLSNLTMADLNPFSKTATVEALKESADPTTPPTADQKAGVAAANQSFLSRITPTMSMPDFSAALASLRTSISNLFGKKAAVKIVEDNNNNYTGQSGIDNRNSEIQETLTTAEQLNAGTFNSQANLKDLSLADTQSLVNANPTSQNNNTNAMNLESQSINNSPITYSGTKYNRFG